MSTGKINDKPALEEQARRVGSWVPETELLAARAALAAANQALESLRVRTAQALEDAFKAESKATIAITNLGHLQAELNVWKERAEGTPEEALRRALAREADQRARAEESEKLLDEIHSLSWKESDEPQSPLEFLRDAWNAFSAALAELRRR